MEHKELGATGVKLPEVGLGTWEYRGSVEPLKKGIALGASFIDTAEMYGTELVVGEAIRKQRDQVFLATKVSGNHLRYDEVVRAAEQSLKRLGVERIDLYQIHWPARNVPMFGMAYFEPAKDKVVSSIHQQLEALAGLVREEERAGLPGSVMISDAFFPYRDGADVGIRQGVSAILQAGGSMRDFETIEACNQASPQVAMKFTGQRSFKH